MSDATVHSVGANIAFREIEKRCCARLDEAEKSARVRLGLRPEPLDFTLESFAWSPCAGIGNWSTGSVAHVAAVTSAVAVASAAAAAACL